MTEPAGLKEERPVGPRRTLRAKVLLFFVAPAVLILGGIAALLPRANEDAALRLAGERNGEIAALLAQQLSRDLIGYVALLDRAAARPEIYGYEPAAQKLALRALVGQLRPFDGGVVVVDADGRVVATDGRAVGLLGAEWRGYAFSQAALAGGSPAVISDVESLPSGDVVALALPIRVPGEGDRGFLAGLFRVAPETPNGLADALLGLPTGEDRRLIVLDARGRAIHSGSAQLSEDALERYAALKDGAAQRFTEPGSGAELLLVAAAVPETGWRLLLSEPWGRMAASYRGATRLVLGLLLLGAVVPALIAAVGIDRLTRPIAALTAAISAAAGGQLGDQVDVRTGDELELLADQFNAMSTRLADSYAELEQRVAERTAELNRLYEQAEETATLAERNRLARELHDSVTQTLFSAKLIADVLPRLWERDPAIGAAKLEELRRLTGGALAEMRSLLVELRPDALAEADLGELLTNLAGAAQARATARIAVEAQKGLRLPAEVQETYYRVAQEALNNALKHAEAETIRIRLAEEAVGVVLEVTDDGQGFDLRSRSPGGHYGLRIMSERAETVCAELGVRSAPGRGATVTLLWRP